MIGQPMPQGHDPLQLLALAMALAQAMQRQPQRAGPPGIPTFGQPFPPLDIPRSIHGTPAGREAPVRIARPPAGVGRRASDGGLAALAGQLVRSPRSVKSIHGTPSGPPPPVRINGGLP